MRAFFLSIFLLVISAGLINSQSTTFQKDGSYKLVKLGSVDVSTIQDDYIPHLQSLEAPSVSGNKYKMHLAKVKEEIAEKYPKSDVPLTQTRSAVNPPEVITGYEITGIQNGIPVDNHLAMHENYIVSAGNFYMAITNEAGGTFKKFSLTAFANAAGVSAQPFDPRLAYDPEANRFVFTFLAGFESNDTHIVIAFSETDDPRSRWNIYRIEGNPNSKPEWTDYPMLAITNDNVYLTINLLRDNESWQLGFVETIIWEIDKYSGYNDEPEITINKYDNITFEGFNIRNLCPVESADEVIYDDMYFVSNRNFSMETDSFFLIHFNPEDSINPIDIKTIPSTQPYGAPPNAEMRVGQLQTNDARVLEAYRLGDEIQFVGNTRNLNNNKAGIYHGIIEDINTSTEIKLEHIIGSNYELGYPGITYVGTNASERDAIISVNHSSKSRSPGTSAIYSIPEEGYSPIVEVSSGATYVDMLTSTVERWGDYHGTQRDPDNPTEVWSSGFYVNRNRVNTPYISKVVKPAIPTGTYEVQQVASAKVFPNPTSERIQVEFNIPEGLESISVELLNSSGKLINQIYSTKTFRSGSNQFSMNIETLTAGNYFVRITSDKGLLSSTKFIKQ